MKILKLILFFSLVILSSILSEVNGQVITPGVWKLDRSSVETDLRAKDKETLSKLPDQKRIEVIEELSSRTFSFFKDGSFQAEWTSRGRQEKLVGKWHVEDGQLFIDSGVGINTYEILISNEKKLVLVPNAKVGFFQKLVFTKPE